MNNMFNHYIQLIEQELDLSDPMPGVTVTSQVESFNKQFVFYMIEYVSDHVLKKIEKPQYTVSDGEPTSRFGPGHHSKSANDILRTWDMHPSRGVQGRDDSHGDLAGRNSYWGPGNYSDQSSQPTPNCNYPGNVQTGITFCDQSDMNTSNHLEQFHGTFYMQNLNKTAPNDAHFNNVIGNSDPANDRRLLNRNIFKANERGDVNGIKAYEQRIHRRNFDRDIKETLPGREREGLIHGYDMTSLYERNDAKRAAKTRKEVPNKQHLEKKRVFYSEKNYY